MGTDALLTSGVTEKMLYLVRDPRARSPSDPLNRVRKTRIALFALVELIGFGATFAITQTIAAIGFPVIIMLLVPLRVFVVPHLGFTPDELSVLDGAVASPFVSVALSASASKRCPPPSELDPYPYWSLFTDDRQWSRSADPSRRSPPRSCRPCCCAHRRGPAPAPQGPCRPWCKRSAAGYCVAVDQVSQV
jgi:hypothetical protein